MTLREFASGVRTETEIYLKLGKTTSTIVNTENLTEDPGLKSFVGSKLYN